MSRIHPQARTTPRTRAEINASTEPVKVLAQLYNITVATARKWHERVSMEDRSHCQHKLSIVLTPVQEAVVVELRRLLLLPLDDLLVVTREFINPAVSRSGLDHCLRRHDVGSLKALLEQQSDEPQKLPKIFKDYEPGFIHIDIKYLAQMPDERSRRYLFVAIDRATRWVYMRIYRDQSELSSSDFLRRLSSAALNRPGFELTPRSWTNFKGFHEEVPNRVQAQGRQELFSWRRRSEAASAAVVSDRGEGSHLGEPLPTAWSRRVATQAQCLQCAIQASGAAPPGSRTALEPSDSRDLRHPQFDLQIVLACARCSNFSAE